MFVWDRKKDGYEFQDILEEQVILASSDLFQIERPEGQIESGELDELNQKEHVTYFTFRFKTGLLLKGVFRPGSQSYPHGCFHLRLGNPTEEAISMSLKFNLLIPTQSTPRWMIPALFYKDNCPEGNTKLYPRFDSRQFDPERWISHSWSFRSDRSSHPGIFAFTQEGSVYVGTDADTPLGVSGLYFASPEGEIPRMGLRFPFEEAPRTYANCHDPEQKPVKTFATLKKGQEIQLRIWIAFGPPDLHFYHPVLKDRYHEVRLWHPVQPWVTPQEAIPLCAEGLYLWHYDPKQKVIYETCSFDKYFGLSRNIPGMPYVDRPHMHVGWVSGAPAAYGLLASGNRLGNEGYCQAGINVLDRIAEEGVSPCGLFWSQWTHEKGWDTGWNPKPNWLQGRTTAESVLFFLKARKLEQSRGQNHPKWEKAIRSNLDSAIRVQGKDGNFGSYYDCGSGEVQVWEGTGSLLWIAALIEASRQFGKPEYLDAARLAGDYYRQFVDDEYLYGAPEDVHLTPTSEDGYNALIAYWALYRATGDERYRDLAKKAADWSLSFRWCYNLKFSMDTLLGTYDFRTQGGDLASPCNQHLHPYGLICFPEMNELAEELQDSYYWERAMDHLACFLQFIAREDGDFGARKGMTPEQFYHTDWWQPKGHLLALAHAWTSGLILYASLWIGNQDGAI